MPSQSWIFKEIKTIAYGDLGMMRAYLKDLLEEEQRLLWNLKIQFHLKVTAFELLGYFGYIWIVCQSLLKAIGGPGQKIHVRLIRKISIRGTEAFYGMSKLIFVQKL